MQHSNSRPTVSRRRLLKSLGAAAAGAALLPAFGIAEDSPTSDVEDSASGIRITDLQPHPAGDRVYV